MWVDGYATFPNDARETNVADYILCKYEQDSAIPIRDLEGSFVVAVHDARQHRILIYRNLAGAINLFFASTNNGLLYSTNLARLLKLFPRVGDLNESLLPVFFLYRCIPGRETLFKEVTRLMPGELLEFTDGRITTRQATSFDDYRGQVPLHGNLLEQINDTIGAAVSSCYRAAPSSAVLLSGGVDSTLLQSHFNLQLDEQRPSISYCATLDHPRTIGELAYAHSAADLLGVTLRPVQIERPYLEYLDYAISSTGETPNHVQAAYFPAVAQAMSEDGLMTGITGEAADGLFGVATQDQLHRAAMIRSLLPTQGRWLAEKLAHVGLIRTKWRSILELADRLDDFTYLHHPTNLQAMFAHLDSVIRCFGEQCVINAMSYRLSIVERNGLNHSHVERLHGANLLTSSINSATYWNTLTETRGISLYSPFLDSRMIRLAMSIADEIKFQYRKPKQLLKQALAVRTHKALAYRKKLSFGQPIFEWLGRTGQLNTALEEVEDYSFIDKRTYNEARDAPNWFLYNVLCFDRLSKHVKHAVRE
ncbi:asparagine synthase-related protein [Aeoliella mucimassa]|uniref:asparagine synthase-related protein n=1 Tax=Aeoliella mucimassa TaxID=2527972 RepID=UPI0018D4A543|nr:asparagine synthase-related protein [Aeoliella mucimassa]